MAKKISKHSRAARRNEIVEPEAKSLSSLPRAEKTDTTSAIIRATAKKNEELLNTIMVKKGTKDKVSKKKATAATNLSKDKIERAMALTDKLDVKINKSKQRAKFVQTARKSNWDAINAQARETLGEKDTTLENDEDQEKDSEDEMVDDFYNDQDTSMGTGSRSVNAFSLLEEVEA